MEGKINIKSILIVTALLLIIMLFINISLAANTGVINAQTVNVRETADAESKILKQLPINQEVEVLETEGDWYKIKCENVTGYVRKDLVTVNNENQTQNNETNTQNTNVENTSAENTNTAQNNTQNNSTNNNATLTEANSKLGDYVVNSDTKLKLVPTINATDVIDIKKDEKVKVTEIINGWACVEFNTSKGWIRKDKLQREEQKQEEQQVQEQPAEQQTEQPTTKIKYINVGTVNVRKEPNSSSEIVANASLNDEVEVESETDGWSKVKVNNKEGYIASSLLSDNKQETSRSMTTSRKSTTKKEQTKSEVASSTTQNKSQSTTSNSGSGTGSSIVATAKKYLGYKYVYGGSSPSTGFDCSGFTSYVYKQHGISLNRTAAGQYSNGVSVSRANLQPGDLVMFGSPINHVAIYIGGGQIIHASTPSTGVRIDSLNSGYYSKNYTGARRII